MSDHGVEVMRLPLAIFALFINGTWGLFTDRSLEPIEQIANEYIPNNNGIKMTSNTRSHGFFGGYMGAKFITTDNREIIIEMERPIYALPWRTTYYNVAQQRFTENG
ncbi:MAG: hypothetical protein MJH10_20145, partial [Epibacterium sp.]|nr:hypothetical protein [Epibacterium sp.]